MIPYFRLTLGMCVCLRGDERAREKDGDKERIYVYVCVCMCEFT